MTVVTHAWGAFRGTLRRYERNPGESWKETSTPIDVVIGRAGYGWGRGVHGEGPPAGRPGPTKREGDGRSPAGVFDFGVAYGYASALENISLPYVQATAELRCVDDPGSLHYNSIVSTTSTTRDWQSAEHMRRRDDLYAIAIVVEHNTDATKPGAGSCIFVHAWRDADTGMSGCTAMPMHALEGFSTWLKPDAAALVALPRGEYDALKSAWELP